MTPRPPTPAHNRHSAGVESNANQAPVGQRRERTPAESSGGRGDSPLESHRSNDEQAPPPLAPTAKQPSEGPGAPPLAPPHAPAAAPPSLATSAPSPAATPAASPASSLPVDPRLCHLQRQAEPQQPDR